jgi:lipoate-protein ligase A
MAPQPACRAGHFLAKWALLHDEVVAYCQTDAALSKRMHLLDLTLPTPAENLALDEALLEAAEAGELSSEVLRIWESPVPMVVVGRSSHVEVEVNLDECRRLAVPMLRRASGGASVVAGPGCLMYEVVLRYAGREQLRLIDEVHRHVLGVLQSELLPLAPAVEHRGICDLVVSSRKFSGNAVRCKRDHLLYHGTMLYDFDLELIPRLLRMPPRQPEYRAARNHTDFLTNLQVPRAKLVTAIAAAFGAQESLSTWPQSRTADLVTSRYAQDSWNFSR